MNWHRTTKCWAVPNQFTVRGLAIALQSLGASLALRALLFQTRLTPVYNTVENCTTSDSVSRRVNWANGRKMLILNLPATHFRNALQNTNHGHREGTEQWIWQGSMWIHWETQVSSRSRIVLLTRSMRTYWATQVFSQSRRVLIKCEEDPNLNLRMKRHNWVTRLKS